MVVLEIILVDAETGSPIAYTPVWANEAATSTNAAGSATFEVAEGPVTIKVRSPVYEPLLTKVSAPGKIKLKLRRLTL